MRKIRIKLPDEAYDLLEQGAQEAGSSVEDFALFCVFSVLANYAVELEADTRIPVPTSDGPDPAYTLDALSARMVFNSDLTP